MVYLTSFGQFGRDACVHVAKTKRFYARQGIDVEVRAPSRAVSPRNASSTLSWWGEMKPVPEDRPVPIHHSNGRVLLTPRDVRMRRFNATTFGRRGFEPDEVRDFLMRVEVDMAVLYQELAAAREETQRLKAALREWQAQHSSRQANTRPDRHEQHRRHPEMNQAWPLSPPHPNRRNDV